MSKPRCPRRRKYPIRELAVGDSFLVPEADTFKNLAQTVRNVASDVGAKVAVRRVDGGVRVWRVA
jgi:hypothetical protein